MIHMLRNQEFRKVIILFTVGAITFSIFQVFYSRYQWESYYGKQLETELSVIGHLVNEFPDTETWVRKNLLMEISADSIQTGIKKAEAFGFSKEQIEHIRSINQNYSFHNQVAVFLFSLGQFLFYFIVILVAFRYLYSRINAVSLGADLIMQGNFITRFPEDDEGDLAILGLQFNQMSKRLQITLKQLTDEKDRLKQLIADVSHQLKTPLSSIKMFNELILDQKVEDKYIQIQFLEKSKVQLERMEWLIQTMLKISRLEIGVYPLQMTETDMGKTVLEVTGALEQSSREKDQIMNVSVRLSSRVPHDARWFGEALENIVSNAIEYTPIQGEISVTAEESEFMVALTVKDNGIGIPEKDLPFIFERFYRGKNTNVDSVFKSGIGLALTQIIVKKHGGFIDVSSEIDKGTTVSISLPKNNRTY